MKTAGSIVCFFLLLHILQNSCYLDMSKKNYCKNKVDSLILNSIKQLLWSV